MKILILVAMDKELRLLLQSLDSQSTIDADGITAHYGRLAGHEVYVAKCGIGKVNAAVNAWRLIEFLHPDRVINSGVAGGAGLPIGSVLVADSVAYHDVWCGPGTEYGAADGFPQFFQPDRRIIEMAYSLGLEVVNGLICSGDKFISTAEEVAEIRGHFPDVKAVDMESAPLAQVCDMASLPFNVVRVVSDTPGEGENVSQYKNFWDMAPEKTFHVVKALIEKL